MAKAPLTGIALYLLIFALGLAAFVDGLDFSIANVAITSIAASFGVTPQEGTWVITLFAVSDALSLCLSGMLANHFGGVRVILVCIAIFTISSFFCGIAWSFNSLIFFRIIQGCAAGPLMTLPQSLMLANAPEDKKQIGTSILIMLIVLAPVLGPFVGGWITENYGWPWIFFINIPLGILALLMTWGLLHDRETTIIKSPTDLSGIVLLVIGIGTLQVLLDKGNDLDWFGSTQIVLMAIIAGLGILFFIIWNLFSDNPVIEFSYFKDLNFTMGTILTTLPYLVIGGTTIIIPLWLQTQKGYTPYWAGVAVMPLGILPIMIAPFLGPVMAFLGMRIVVAAGFAVLAWTSFWFSNFTADASLYEIMLPRFFQGAGIALCFIPLFQITLSHIKDEDINFATGVHNSVRTILGGAGISTALYVTLWQQRESLHHSNLTEVMHPLHTSTLQAYEKLNEVGVDNEGVAMVFDALLTNQAYVMAFNDLLWLSGWVLLLMIPCLLLCKEPAADKIRSMG